MATKRRIACAAELHKMAKDFLRITLLERSELAAGAFQNNLAGKIFKTPYAEKLEKLKLQRILRYTFEIIIVSVIVQA